jgi:hypothetical protein
MKYGTLTDLNRRLQEEAEANHSSKSKNWYVFAA